MKNGPALAPRLTLCCIQEFPDALCPACGERELEEGEAICKHCQDERNDEQHGYIVDVVKFAAECYNLLSWQRQEEMAARAKKLGILARANLMREERG